MRVAVVSDIHGNLPALLAVVDDFGRREVDAVINLGDLVSGPLMPLETARYLMQQPWTQLAGNHERQVLTHSFERQGLSDRFARAALGDAELAWMASLPTCRAFDEEVLLCHGSPRSDLEYFMETLEPHGLRMASQAEVEERAAGAAAEVILCGHTHVPRALRCGAQLIVNPGSVGLQAYGDDEPFPHVVENGSPDARYAILERSVNGWQVELRSVPYAHQEMAALAASNGRADWAQWLATGYAAASKPNAH